MYLIKTINSKLDSTIKFVFKTNDNLFIENSYINKEDGKIIICVPSETFCDFQCEFCHLTHCENPQQSRVLLADELYSLIINTLYWLKRNDFPVFNGTKVLLISFMGVGEPLNNVRNLVPLMDSLTQELNKEESPLKASAFNHIRFAISTMVPTLKLSDLLLLSKNAADCGFDLKIHYSLHYLDKEKRSFEMPFSLDSEFVLSALNYIAEHDKHPIEIHYTLIKGENDSEEEIIALSELGFPVKFLKFAELPDSYQKAVSYEDYLDRIEDIFEENRSIGSSCEFYDPPGSDIGSSCGQICPEDWFE